MRQKKNLLLVGIAILCAILLCSVGIDIIKKYRAKEFPENRENSLTEVEELREETVIKDLPEEKETEAVEQSTTEEELPEKMEIPEEDELDETVNKVITVQEPVIPKDIYVLRGKEGKICCSFPNAQEYVWEYYSEEEKDWKMTAENTELFLTGEMDELNRNVSTLIIKGDDKNDGLLIKCTVKVNEEEEQSYQAAFHVLPFKAEDIKEIEITEEYEAEAGSYISTRDIPVKVKMGEQEEVITGLSDLFFCVPKNVEGDVERKDNGTTVETVKTTTVENQYYLTGIGESKVMLRYRGTTPGKDAEIIIKGKDSSPPEVNVRLSGYEVNNHDLKEAVVITAEIEATDNYSPLTKLLFAIKPQGEKIKETDFEKSSKTVLEVKNNGAWTAYVKDEVGNIGTSDVDIIVVDQKMPVIKTLKVRDESENWLKENIIVVEAEDKTAISYRYICADTDSGWTEKNEYIAKRGGEWKVMVKDAAGNENSKTISIKNIDNMPPVIHSALPKKSDEEVINTGTLEDRVSVTVNGMETKTASGESSGTTSNSNTNDNIYGKTDGTVSNSANTAYRNTTGNSSMATVSKGEKGERGAAGAAGKDGNNSYIHIKYASDAAGTNMTDTATDSSRYMGVYAGTSVNAPTSADSYKWSEYKDSSSKIYIRYAEDDTGSNMTEQPTEKSCYMGICMTEENAAPAAAIDYTWSQYREPGNQLYIRYAEDAAGTGMTEQPTESSCYIGICNTSSPVDINVPESYVWSVYRDSTVTETMETLQNQIVELQNQIEELKKTE